MNSAAQRKWLSGQDERTARLHGLRAQARARSFKFDGEHVFLIATALAGLPGNTFNYSYAESVRVQLSTLLMGLITQEQRQAIAEWTVESEQYQSYGSTKKP